MKKWIVLLMLVVSLPVSAAFLYGPDGRDRVRKGDSAAKVSSVLGRPGGKSVEVVCAKKDRDGYCKRYTKVEIWHYRVKDLNWTLYISGGEVVEMKWSRF